MFKFKTVLCGCLVGLMLICLTTAAGAAVIYEQSLSKTDNYGFISNINSDLSADNFILTGSSLIQSISWYGMYESADENTMDTFDIRIFDLSGTELFSNSGLVSVSRSDSGFTDVYGATIYMYNVAVADWKLPANEYLFSVSNGNSDYSNWYWADGVGDGISYYQDSSSWVAEDLGADMAFTLNGEPAAVPIPGSLLLLGSASGVLTAARYRKRPKK